MAIKPAIKIGIEKEFGLVPVVTKFSSWIYFSKQHKETRRMFLKTLQIEQDRWNMRNFGMQSGMRMLIGVMEELGELSHAHLKASQSIRVNEDHEAAKKDAVGDIVIYLAGYCNSENIDFAQAVEDAWQEVSKRDWQKNKINGADLEEVET